MQPVNELEEARAKGQIPDLYENVADQIRETGITTENETRATAKSATLAADYGSIEERALAHEAEATQRVADNAKEDPNTVLQYIDARVRLATNNPQLQLAILIMACTLAVRRVCVGAGVFDRGRRSKIIKSAVQQFDGKLRKFVWRTPG